MSHFFYSHTDSFYFRPTLNLRPFLNYLYHISQRIFVDTSCPLKSLLADTQFVFQPDCLGQLTPIFAKIFRKLIPWFWEFPNLAGLPQNQFLQTSSIYKQGRMKWIYLWIVALNTCSFFLGAAITIQTEQLQQDFT